MNKKLKLFLGSLPFIAMSLFFLIVYAMDPHGKDTHGVSIKNGILTLEDCGKYKLFSIKGNAFFSPCVFLETFQETDVFAPITASFYHTPLKSRFGFGAYSFRIKGLKPDTVYALHTGHALSSCSVYINGVKRAQQGKPASSRSAEEPGIVSTRAVFRAMQDGTADIVINISNFRNRKSGFSAPLLLGEYANVEKRFHSDLLFNTGVFAGIFTVVVFFFLLPFFYPRSSFIWLFDFVAMVSAVRSSLFYPHIAAFLIPSMSWHTLFIIKYCSFPLLVLFFMIFMKRALNLWFKIPYILILCITSAYALSTVILPPEISALFVNHYQLFSFLCIVYVFIISVYGIRKKIEHSIWIFCAMLIMTLFGTYDLLVGLGIIHGKMYIQLGSLVIILMFSVMILDQYAGSIKKLQNLNKEILSVNKSFSRFFPDKIIKLLKKKSIAEIALGDNADIKMPIMFIDIRSFTSISEKLMPDQVFNLLNEYFALVVPIVRAQGGIITKYYGDGFFALFPEGADNALSCAIQIQQKLKSEKPVTAENISITAGIGIDFDSMLLGTIGDINRMDNIIISNASYTAEILQNNTKKYKASILISERIVMALKDPNRYLIRPVQLAKGTAEKQLLLFEVYDCDSEEDKKYKRLAQPHIERGLHAAASGNIKKALYFFYKALQISPSDSVALHYKNLIAMRRAVKKNSRQNPSPPEDIKKP